MEWSNASIDSQIYRIVGEMGNAIEAAASKNGAALRFRFMNDANDRQNVLGTYGAASLERLRDIAGRYDPSELFQRFQNGGWLLSKTS